MPTVARWYNLKATGRIVDNKEVKEQTERELSLQGINKGNKKFVSGSSIKMWKLVMMKRLDWV